MDNEIKKIYEDLDKYKLSIDKVTKGIEFLQGYLDGLLTIYKSLVKRIDMLNKKETTPSVYIGIV